MSTYYKMQSPFIMFTDKYQQSARTRGNRPTRHQESGGKSYAMDQRHPLNGHLGMVPRLKSRMSFIKCTEPINTMAKVARMELWRERLEPLDASVHLNISADEHLPAGAENPWTTWKALNRLRTQVGRSRVNMQSGDFPTNTKRVTVASGRQCNTCGLPHDGHCLLSPRRERLTTGIGRARFEGHTTPGGRTRMVMSTCCKQQSPVYYVHLLQTAVPCPLCPSVLNSSPLSIRSTC